VDISAVKAAIADAVRVVPRLEVYRYVPDQPVVSCFYLGEVEIDPHQTFGGSDVATITARVLTSGSEDESGQIELDQLLSRTGPRSIRAALWLARGAPGELALGGLADDLVVDGISGYRSIPAGEVSYYGAEIKIRVVGSEVG
jgi:hypothetical protein